MSHMPSSGRPLIEQVLRYITPSALAAGSTHNYSPVDATTGVTLAECEVVRQATNAAGSTLTGLAAQSDGHFVTFVNLGPGTLTLIDGSGSSAKPFALPGNANIVLEVDRCASLMYDATSDLWRIVVGEGVPSTAGFITGTGTTNAVAKWTGAGALGGSLITDDGTTVAVNTNKLTVVAASGNTAIAGTLAAGATSISGTLAATGTATLNSASGNTTIGAGSATGSTLTFNGRESVFSSAPVGLGAGTSMVFISRAGTFDTSAGALDSRAINCSVSSSRSAGANNLTNTAALFSAANGQVNVALQTNSGDVILNNSGGTTTIKGATTCQSTLSAAGITSTGSLTVNSGSTVSIGSATSFVNFNNTSFDGPILQTREVVPPQITGNQNDYSPTNMVSAAVLLINSNAAVSISGFATGVAGRWLWVYNTGAFNITLTNQDPNSAAANRVLGRGGANTVLTPNTGVQLYYSPSLTRWIVMTDTL